MMSKDITKKKLEDYDDVVSDVVNNLLFDGKKVLDENNLEKLPTEEFTKVGDRQRQGNHDVKKAEKQLLTEEEKNGGVTMCEGLKSVELRRQRSLCCS